MLFLLNDQIIEIDSPEARLNMRWHALGCTAPDQLRARDAIDFATRIMDDLFVKNASPDADMATDLAALIIARTGANAILFARPQPGRTEPRLTVLPEPILETLRTRATETGKLDLATIWPLAA